MARPTRPARTRLLRTKEVAEIFDVVDKTVLDWVKAGKLPARRTPGGQQYRFHPEDVEAYRDVLAVAESVHEDGRVGAATPNPPQIEN